jgi:APA family basic amino acid/polyamine antiporter
MILGFLFPVIPTSQVTMFTAGLLALLFDIEILSELVSIGTLVVFAMICCGVVFRRYYVRGQGGSLKPVGLRIGGIIISSVAFSLSYTEKAPIAVPIVFFVAWLASTATLLQLPVLYIPTKYKCPGSPWLPSFGVLSCLHLIGSLGWPAYVRWLVWFTLGTIVYLCYGLHQSQGEGQRRTEARNATSPISYHPLNPLLSPTDTLSTELVTSRGELLPREQELSRTSKAGA